MSAAPDRRTWTLRDGTVIFEVVCPACQGSGAWIVDGRPAQIRDLKRPEQQRLAKLGYAEHQIAPCPGCRGVGWARRRDEGGA